LSEERKGVCLRYVSIVALALGLLIVAPVVTPASWHAAEAKKASKKSKKSQPARVTTATARARSQLTNAGTAASAPTTTVDNPTTPDASATSEAPRRQVAPANLTISTDKASYKTGDLMTIGVSTDVDCDLTVIGIDSENFATVLFPNDFDPDNQLNGGAPMSFPKADAPYQLRARTSGLETILGICSEPGFRPNAINADYERNRFTQLGDWQDFSTNKDAREKDIQTEAAAALALAKRKRRKLPMPLLPVGDVTTEGRALLLVPVE
jgi:Domain of unknown function (DUF4384)